MRRFLALAVVLMLAQPVHAQPANCQAQWLRLSETVAGAFGVEAPTPGIVRELANGGCRTNGLTFKTDEKVSLKAESLQWRGRDMERFVTEGLPPTAFDLEVKGVRVVPTFGDPAYQYLLDLQSRGQNIEVGLALDWDEAEKVLRVENLLISLPNEDFIRYAARIEGVDLSTKESLQMSAGSFGVTGAELVVRSERFFQNYLLFPLGLALLNGHPNPEARIAELKAEARGIIATVPERFLSSTSKAALGDLLDDLPEPSGILRIEQRADPGIGVARGMAMAMRAESMETVADLWTLFDGVEVDIHYDRF